ncbi:MAG: hypothetical protein PW788_02155 [Micavibrio sp.]|nr:hypothetical protein [Micavibrio sp.]
MDFYRLFHGLPYDARLAVIAKRSTLSKGETLALFIALHDHASQSLPRGSLAGFDAEQVALALDLDPAKVTAALEALADKGMIAPDHTFTEWARQLSPSTERVRRHRARKRAAGQLIRKRPPLLDADDPAEAARRRQRLQSAPLSRNLPPIYRKDTP